MADLRHRAIAYRQLRGRGLEIGALHEPAPVPAEAQVEYFDAMTEQEAAQLFPEIDSSGFVHVSHIGDIDRDGLAQFADGTFEFVIMNHVLEHLANPIKAVAEVFRILRPRGQLVVSVPDKRFTFDKLRPDTPFDHLWSDYQAGVSQSTDEHYIEFFRSAAPHVFAEPPENLPIHVRRARERREHSHAWTSETFRAFLDMTFAKLGIAAVRLFESPAEQNEIEYFSLWEKQR